MIVAEKTMQILVQKVIGKQLDLNSCIIVDNKYNSYNKRWCSVFVGNNSDSIFLRFVICSPDLYQHKLILTSSNMFNLQQAGSETAYTFTAFDPNLINISDCPYEHFTPHISSRIILIRRHNDQMKWNMAEQNMLLNYFSYSRYLCVGDVFSINTKHLNIGLQYLSYDFPEILYYKVHCIEGPEYQNETGLSKILFGYIVTTSTELKITSASNNFFLPPEYDKCINLEKRYQKKSEENTMNFSVDEILSSTVRKTPSGLDKYFDEIKSWIYPFLSVERKELEMAPVFLLSGKRGSGKTHLLSCLSEFYGLKYVNENCALLQSDNPVTTETNINNIFKKLPNNAPCLLHFRHIEVLCIDETGNPDYRILEFFTEKLKSLISVYPYVIFCTTTELDKLSKSLHRSFLQVLNIDHLDNEQRLSILNWILSSNDIHVPVQDLENIVQLTSSFVFADFFQLVSRTIKISLKGYLNFEKNADVKSWTLADYSRTEKDLSFVENIKLALDEMNVNYSKSIGAPQIPNITWNDIGGLGNLKSEILTALSTTNLPDGLQRSGLLLYGPPGTGKTLLAKAVATHFKYSFLSIKGPELLDMWVGQSEENVRQVFRVARASAPCIIFFDELDSLAPKRGGSGSGGGVMDRVVSQLLTEMDGIQKKKGVFILAATNRPDLIDSALLRPGRLDKMLFVGAYNDAETRTSIMQALTRKFNFENDINFSALLELLPAEKDITGADFYGICSNAWLNAARRHISNSDEDKDKLKSRVLVSETDMIEAFKEFSGVSDR